MKISEIRLSGFRGFKLDSTIPFDADVVLLTGQNGTGKTSLLDAIQWCLLGTVPRLERLTLKSGEDYVSNRYSETPPVVAMTLVDGSSRFRVSRRGTGTAMQVAAESVTEGGASTPVDNPDAWLAELVGRRLDAQAFLRTFILQQDEVKEFLAADPKERYSFLSQLAGLDDAQQLDTQAKSELRRLREALRELTTEVDEETSRLDALRADRAESESILQRQTVAEDEQLWQSARVLAQAIGAAAPSSSDELQAVASGAGDAIRRVEALRAEIEQRNRAAEIADQEAQQLGELGAALDNTRANVREISERVEGLRIEATRLESEAARLAGRQDRVKQLAELALNQLGNSCPVCDRPLREHELAHAQDHLRNLLEGDETLPLLRQQVDGRKTEAAEAEEELSALLARVQSLEVATRRAQEAQIRADEERAAIQRLSEEARARLPAIPVEPEVLERLRAEYRYLSSALMSLRERGMAGRQLEVLDRDVANQNGILERLRARLEALDGRVRSAEDVAHWIGAQVVRATTEIVRTSTPLINELYARLDVHPYLRRFDFRSDRFYEAGRVRPWVYDDDRKVSGNAAQVLSSAQLNALAVCLFLALNIGQRSSALDIAVLDDPVQSMDDVNVLGLADILRSVRRHRQLVVATHDPALTDLLWRKLRPFRPSERTRLIELSEWTTAGPRVRVETREPELERERLELVAS